MTDVRALADEPLISLRGVGKEYPVVRGRGGRIRTLWALWRGQRDPDGFTALDGIDLDVMPGQSVGLIGENGAGKSTLLKIIAGVVKASRGRVSINGRVGALLELGAGFHPDYTGRENIYLATALMGMSRRETRERLDDILAFADIGDQIDQPLKHYSSGMTVRLGFAVATTLRSDILITDEVLAVGDESFQKKCVAWIHGYLADGGTLLLCSHSMYHIQKLCHRAAWIDHGRMRVLGSSADVTREYLAYHEARARERRAPAGMTPGLYQITSLSLNGSPDPDGCRIALGQSLRVTGRIRSPDGRRPNVMIGVVRIDGTAVYGVANDMDGHELEAAGQGEFAFGVEFDALSLLPGKYLLRAHPMDPEGFRLFDETELSFDVVGDVREVGLCRLPHRWLDDTAGLGIAAEDLTEAS